jgi:hypothetical protein
MGYAFIIWMWPQQPDCCCLLIVVSFQPNFFMSMYHQVCVCTRQSWFTWCDDADVRQSKRSKRVSQYRNVLRFKFEGKNKFSRQKRMRLWLWLSDGAPGGFFFKYLNATDILSDHSLSFILLFCVCVALPTGNHFRLPLPRKLRMKKKGKRFDSLPSVGWTSNNCLEKKRWNAVAPMMGGHRNAINIRSIILFFSFQVDKFKF